MSKAIEQNSSRQVRGAAVVSYISIAINILAGLLYTPWIIAHIGKGDYGVYTIATSVITLLIMDFGISEAVAKYVAQYRTEGRDEEINNLLGLVLKIYLLLSVAFLVFFIIFYFFIDTVYAGLTAEEVVKLRSAYIVIALYNVFAFAFTPLSGIMLAYEHLIHLKISDVFIRLLTIVISVALILTGRGVLALVLANAAAGIIGIVYKIFVIQRAHSFRPNLHYYNNSLLKKILSFSVWIAVMVISQRCIYSITPSILGALSNSTEVTYFNLSSTLEGYTYYFGSVFATLYLARLTRILLSGDEEKFNDLITRVGKLQLILLLLILTGFICVGRSFVEMWLGDGYSIVYYGTILLLLPDMLLWPFMLPATGLTVVNQIKEYSVVHVIMAVVNVVLEAVLLKQYGAIGAEVAICIASFAKAAMVIFVYKKYLPLHLGTFVRKVFVPYGIVGLLTLIISMFVINLNLIPFGGFKRFFLEALMTGVVYFTGIFIVISTIDKELKAEIKTVMKLH